MAASYKQIRERITSYLAQGGQPKRWAEVLLAGPDLLHLMTNLVADPRVPAAAKLKLAGTIAYFVLPLDLMPEMMVGPVGYLDDTALAALALNAVLSSIPTEVVAEHWAGQGQVLDVVRGILAKASDFLGRRLWGKLSKRK
jgi:uncharacterized membrane protein YkvA (DUF1232 family)